MAASRWADDGGEQPLGARVADPALWRARMFGPGQQRARRARPLVGVVAAMAASSGGVQVKPLFEKGGFKGGGGSGAGNSPRQDSPRADSARSYLNNYWDNFSSNNGQRQVAIG